MIISWLEQHVNRITFLKSNPQCRNNSKKPKMNIVDIGAFRCTVFSKRRMLDLRLVSKAIICPICARTNLYERIHKAIILTEKLTPKGGGDQNVLSDLCLGHIFHISLPRKCSCVFVKNDQRSLIKPVVTFPCIQLPPFLFLFVSLFPWINFLFNITSFIIISSIGFCQLFL